MQYVYGIPYATRIVLRVTCGMPYACGSDSEPAGAWVCDRRRRLVGVLLSVWERKQRDREELVGVGVALGIGDGRGSWVGMAPSPCSDARSPAVLLHRAPAGKAISVRF